jgi:hypothetical protein
MNEKGQNLSLCCAHSIRRRSRVETTFHDVPLCCYNYKVIVTTMGSFFSLPTAVVVVALAILFRPMSPQRNLRKPKTPAGDHQNVDWNKASNGAPKTVKRIDAAINMNTIPLWIVSLSLSLSRPYTHALTLSHSLTQSLSLSLVLPSSAETCRDDHSTHSFSFAF